jgi:hypothetical protein
MGILMMSFPFAIVRQNKVAVRTNGGEHDGPREKGGQIS